MNKRIFDIIFALFIAVLISPLVLLIFLAIIVATREPAIYWSRRVGQHGICFMMPKFRTMHLGTPEVATDKLGDPEPHLTGVGSFLRRTSLDELPQVYSVLIGHMSIVGPRPALYNQKKLISWRDSLQINSLRPGVTGLAQINGRDKITLSQKIDLDLEYMNRASMWLDIQIITLTIFKVVISRDIEH
jgi:O-antigen biosynthesis protein WbqP